MRSKWLLALFAMALLLGTLYALMRRPRAHASTDEGGAQAASSSSPFSSPGVKARRPLVMAHRGGAGLWPENTMYAFERAARLGVDVLEMDLHTTADGALVVIHDDTVDRTTDGSGAVNRLTLDQLKRLDAAYRWTSDGGRSFPLRGRGVSVPTLAELFKAFPRMRFNIDIKQDRPSPVPPLCRLIRETGMTDKVMVASFDAGALEAFRRECAGVKTSASPEDVRAFLALKTVEPNKREASVAHALQVPEYAAGRAVLTKEFVEAAHRRGLEVHAWTINDEAAMRRLIQVGVDGIITDYPDRLIRLLDQR
jgi:glycerophosphoryl diester phosphodiesterase